MSWTHPSYDDPVERVISRLEKVKKSGSGYVAKCPAHDDREPSLSIGYGDDGKAVLYCHAGCDAEEIVSRLGMTMQDLFPKEAEPLKPMPKPKAHANGIESTNGKAEALIKHFTPRLPKSKPDAVYKYKDEAGSLMYEVLRYDMPDGRKTFRQRRPDPDVEGGYIYNLTGCRIVPYHLQELLDADPAKPVFIPEGEKDVWSLHNKGFVATTNSGGGGNWRPEFGTFLQGRHICVLPDNDEQGRKHATAVAQSCYGIAKSVRIVTFPELPEKGDVSDWFMQGHTADDLLELARHTPVWKPDKDDDNLTAVAKSKASGFDLFTVGSLLMEPEEEYNWLLENFLLTGGLSMLAAKPKVGKSTWARFLALCVAQGKPFMGREVQQGPVIYLALEERRASLRNHFALMGATDKDPLMIHAGGAPAKAIEALAYTIQVVKPVLCIIDPIVRFAKVKSFSDYSQVYEALGPVIDVARKSGCHMMLVTHTTKPFHGASNMPQDALTASESEVDVFDSMMGSIGWRGAVDTSIMMLRNNEIRTIQTEQREGVDLPPTVITLDDHGRVNVVAEWNEVKLLERCKKILDYLATVDRAESKDIYPAVGGATELSNAALHRLHEEGLVIRVGEGKRSDPYLYQRV
jgi:putative DNA primase/helicase